MNILVCVKQVPDTDAVKIDPITHTLIRDSAPAIMNPFDALAFETALLLKDKQPECTEVTLLCMGPEAAKSMLREGLAAGADHAYLISGKFAAGSDTLATSYILSRAVLYVEQTKGMRFDIIFTGKHAIDGETAHVGPQLAEHLGYGQITSAIALEVNGTVLQVTQETETSINKFEADLPCVVTVAKAEKPLRNSTLKRRMAVNSMDIAVIDQNALGSLLDLSRCGLDGSPTMVQASFSPETNKDCLLINEASEVASARRLVAVLSDADMI